jgi:hypothetical protein
MTGMNLPDLRGVELLDATFPLPLDRPFTTSDARREGVPRHVLTLLVAHGLLRRPLKSVDLATQAGDSVGLRSHCLSLVVPGGAGELARETVRRSQRVRPAPGL